MTLGQVIIFVDAIRPNAFDNDTKTRFINEAEGHIQTRIMDLAPEDIVTYSYDSDSDAPLMAQPPFDKLYIYYLMAMIDFANGETNKYANTLSIANAAIDDYARWYTKHHSASSPVVSGWYLSAYGLAVMHGCTKTEEEWLASLKGDKGDTGDAATLEIGTISTGEPGTNATVTNSGTLNNAVLDITIPQGHPGTVYQPEAPSGNTVLWIDSDAEGEVLDYTAVSAAVKADLAAAQAAADDAITSETNAADSLQQLITIAGGAASKKYVDDADNLKVNISDIVNDLDAGGASVPLSAEQGKNLKAASDACSTALLEKTSFGVVSGLGVTAQTAPDMTVSAAAGVIYMANGDRFTPTANSALAITAADAAKPRIDIVYISSSGIISYLAGIPASLPSAPNVPTGGQKLAEISVAANQTTIQTENIQDRRRNLWTEAWITPTLLNGWAESVEPVRYMKDTMGFVHIKGVVKNGTLGQAIFTLPVGYRPSAITRFVTINASGTGMGRIDISTNITIIYGSTAWTALDGIVFKAEA